MYNDVKETMTYKALASAYTAFTWRSCWLARCRLVYRVYRTGNLVIEQFEPQFDLLFIVGSFAAEVVSLEDPRR